MARSRMKRLDVDLINLVEERAKKFNISEREASRELAKALRTKGRIDFDIHF